MPRAGKPLDGRTALVTGASRGLGRGLAVGLGELGARVLITGRRRESLEGTAELVRLAGGACEALVVDHGSDAEVAELFGNLRARFDSRGERLDLVVNNAFGGVPFLLASGGVPPWEKSAAVPGAADPTARPGAAWDALNLVGLRGTFVGTAYALRQFAAQGGGVVVNVSSFGGVFPVFDPAYGAGKAAVDRLTAEFAAAAPPGVVCFALYPGLVATESFASQIAEWDSGTAAAPNPHNLQLWAAESPLFVGRALASGVADERLLGSMHGRIVVVAELGRRVGATDEAGKAPLSPRSLRFAVMRAFPWLVDSWLRFLIPDVLIPLGLLMRHADVLKMW